MRIINAKNKKILYGRIVALMIDRGYLPLYPSASQWDKKEAQRAVDWWNNIEGNPKASIVDGGLDLAL